MVPKIRQEEETSVLGLYLQVTSCHGSFFQFPWQIMCCGMGLAHPGTWQVWKDKPPFHSVQLCDNSNYLDVL